MGIKITKNFDLDKRFRGITSEARNKICKVYEKEIIRSMKSGKSPVRRKRWVKYSFAYVEAMKTSGILRALGKKPKPVNLKLSGQLWNSLTCRVKGRKVIISFKDSLADVHNSGTNSAGRNRSVKIPARPLLPTEPGQLFNLKITAAIQNTLDRVVKKFTAP